VHVSSFLVRRYVRLLIPLAAIVIVGAATGVSYSPYTSVTWSLVCELAYYTAYPGLRMLWERYGWGRVIFGSYVIGYGTLAFTSQMETGTSLPLVPDVLSNLPCWLLGCWLVEQISRGRVLTGSLSVARASFVALTVLVGFMHYHWIVSLRWSLPVYGMLSVPWLWREISSGGFPSALARWGRWSYSLYLMHPAALYGVTPLLLWQSAGLSVQLAFGLAVVLVLSFAFYQLVERPSHRLARELSRARLRRAPAPAIFSPPLSTAEHAAHAANRTAG
jgi:peptidoglycan/LPS O-acetylase OafA/YrhL